MPVVIGGEYVESTVQAYQQLEYLDRLIDQTGDRCLIELYQSERQDLLLRCRQAESLFAQMPSAIWSQIMRRRCFSRWPMKRIAHEVGISTRGAYYAFSDAVEWMDSHVPQSFASR